MDRAELVSNLQEYKAQLDQVLVHFVQSVHETDGTIVAVIEL